MSNNDNSAGKLARAMVTIIIAEIAAISIALTAKLIMWMLF